MFDALDLAVPTWNDINNDPHFLGWLSEADQFSGNQRKALLQAAFDANNSARVVAFFKGYLSENATIAPTEQRPGAPATQQVARVSLETLLVPGGVGTHASVDARQGNAGRIYTRAQISQFYTDINKGRYRGKEAERDAVERDIVSASREGRISN